MALTGLLMPFNRKMGMNYLTDVIRNKINDTGSHIGAVINIPVITIAYISGSSFR